MRKKKSGVRKFLDRILLRKERRISAKQRKKIRQELIAEMISDRKEMIIDGAFFDAAAEKFTEVMTGKSILQNSSGENLFLQDYIDRPMIRVDKLPELLLLLGVRVRG